MTDDTKTETGIDYSTTLYLPKTDFPMRAGLPKKEPEIVARWNEIDLYRKLREDGKDRPLHVLHDGPPYANGNIHIGHALNKILKDVITRSFQMRGYNSNYVPGWDCHGLPIEWKIEEQYRAKGQNKDEVPINEFRKECRDFAAHWIEVQTEEFKRLGIVGDFDQPYTTMNYHAEARIAGELLKFAMSGQLYRGSKPVMWSVVERTALAEAEVEYQDYECDTIWVKFPVTHMSFVGPEDRGAPTKFTTAFVVIWTTTPWTIPGNRAIAFSPRIAYGLYEVTSAENDFGPQPGEKLIFADALAEESFAKAKLDYERKMRRHRRHAGGYHLRPSARRLCGYDFDVPLLAGDHVTDDAGTGFVHTAPSHGREDFDAWMDAKRRARGARHPDRHPVPGRRRRLLHQGRARLRPGPRGRTRTRHRRQGQEGRRQQGRHRGADRGRRALRPRPPEAHLSAFLAVQEAGHLPQHAAMVRGDGQGPARLRPFRRRAGGRRYAAQPRARGDRRDALRAGRRPEPPARHDRRPARLGPLAPARLGRADLRLRQ